MSVQTGTSERVCAAGKFFRLGRRKWYVRGLTYGPFPPDGSGEAWPSVLRVRADFAHLADLGANAIRLYHVPPEWLLDEALAHDLRVMVDIPWEKHRCFFEDWAARSEALAEVRRTAATLGPHAALFAISVANEIPCDIVRYYGPRRVAAFVDELLDVAKQAAPECLVTYVNFPTTEYLQPSRMDFCCFNVYLHQPPALAAYLNRLQHLAGTGPLVLGECGVDALRHGEHEQAMLVTTHVEKACRHGLAGSFVFAYTDEWYRGGQLVSDWAFGCTLSDRSERPLAAGLRNLWNGPTMNGHVWPKVSVVVCTYNGAATLAECLDSLMRLDYPEYEVILVDDGSRDETPQIVEQFPQVRYHRQENFGLSAARNVGARLATGEIVAYTDDDCVATEEWLVHLVQGMQDQNVDCIGGPNVPPAEKSWVARCVAASPGGPCHVMLDDHHAEHVPGCNMAFHRETLLELGGFDPQFRQAGDDVDICWRLIDAGHHIGFAPGAMVWHHRRNSVRAYLRQQKGYGRAEALVHFKHPRRYSMYGRSCWQGVIYGDTGAAALFSKPVIYHGQFGSAPFQTIYQRNEFGLSSGLLSLEWHLLSMFVLSLSPLFPLAAGLSGLMLACSLSLASLAAWRAPLPRGAPYRCRGLIAGLFLAQPIVRGWHRIWGRLRQKRLPARHAAGARTGTYLAVADARASGTERLLHWENTKGRGREHLLSELVLLAKRHGWLGDFEEGWALWDVRLVGDRWHDVTLRTATEELGNAKCPGRRFTRARIAVEPTSLAWVATWACVTWCLAAVASGGAPVWALSLAAVLATALWIGIRRSRRHCLDAASRLVAEAAEVAELVSDSQKERRGVLNLVRTTAGRRPELVGTLGNRFFKE